MKKGTQKAPDFLCCKGNPELVAVFSKERGVGVWGKFSIEKSCKARENGFLMLLQLFCDVCNYSVAIIPRGVLA